MKYIIFRNIEYYPYVDGEYETLKEAKEEYDSLIKHCSDGEIFLCRIIERRQEGMK